jgi:hypothetical protein
MRALVPPFPRSMVPRWSYFHRVALRTSGGKVGERECRRDIYDLWKKGVAFAPPRSCGVAADGSRRRAAAAGSGAGPRERWSIGTRNGWQSVADEESDLPFRDLNSTPRGCRAPAAATLFFGGKNCRIGKAGLSYRNLRVAF